MHPVNLSYPPPHTPIAMHQGLSSTPDLSGNPPGALYRQERVVPLSTRNAARGTLNVAVMIIVVVVVVVRGGGGGRLAISNRQDSCRLRR